MQPERLIAWTEDPLNAETPLEVLCRSEVTPTDLFFVRSHGPVPVVDADAYRLVVDGGLRQPLTLTLEELRGRFPRATVAATLCCAGNRRSELDTFPDAVPWGAGAIGNAVWSGARLRDLLLAAEVEPEGRHVAFTGLDEVDAGGRVERFGASIPIDKALAAEVLLAYEMNGEPLPAEHGFPLRAVVPGYIGARSVKWLAAISVQREQSESFFQRTDYTLGGEPLGELPLNSVACAPADGRTVRGYAVAGGGRSVERVEVSCDEGATWHDAALSGGGAWTWRLWRAELAPGADEVLVRASDDSGGCQPQAMPAVPNPRGYANNAWHRVRLAAAGKPEE
jgi:sulfite oxidase